jgi:thioredoxin
VEAKWGHLHHSLATAIRRLPIETMKRILASLIVLFALFSTSCAQSKKEEKKEEASVIQMDKQMFLDKVFNYTTGATEWKYQGDKPAVIDFYATWCRPCKMLAPELKALQKEYNGKLVIYKIDVDKEPQLARFFGVKAMPTLFFIPMQGKATYAQGYMTQDQLKAIVDQYFFNNNKK